MSFKCLKRDNGNQAGVVSHGSGIEYTHVKGNVSNVNPLS